MNETNLSSETLTVNSLNSQTTLHVDDDLPIKETITPKFKNNVIQKLQDKVEETYDRHKQTLKFSCWTFVHIIFIGYFSWATYFFINNSIVSLDETTCSGYGFLMIIFILVNFGLFYYLTIKPYIIPIINKTIWRRFRKTIKTILLIRFLEPILYLIIFLVIIAYLIYDTSDNRRRLIPLCGLILYLLLGYLFSKHRQQIKWHPVIWGLILQFIFGLLTIRWEVGRNIFSCIGNKTTSFLSYATKGAAFVYGDFLIYKQMVFVFQALSTIFFLSFMINILYYYGIMQKLIVTLGEFLQKVMKTTICESVNSAANIFLGMSETPLLLKPYLEDLTASEILSVMTSGFATVSGTVLAAYISFGAQASHLITASVMSAPAALCYSKLIHPEIEETRSTKESIALIQTEYHSALDAASKGASTAMEVVLSITANLIAFIAFIAFLNGVLTWMGILVGYEDEHAWSIEQLVGYLFMPVSFIMGVPWDECEMVGKLIGIKTVVNEFAAFKEMGTMILTPRTKVIATYAICGFSNPGSIGIMISTLSVLIPKKSHLVTALVFRAFVAGAVVCFMTACIAALLIPENLINI